MNTVGLWEESAVTLVCLELLGGFNSCVNFYSIAGMVENRIRLLTVNCFAMPYNGVTGRTVGDLVLIVHQPASQAVVGVCHRVVLATWDLPVLLSGLIPSRILWLFC